jgi:hypothetical protein
MDIRSAIAEQLENLPLEMQQQVLRFATSLTDSPVSGEHGTSTAGILELAGL